MTRQYVLASRSPRRRELLACVVPPEQIVIVPPLSSEEAEFDGMTTWPRIRERLLEIALHKARQVQTQLGPGREKRCLIAADTTVIVATDRQPISPSHTALKALGQPRADADGLEEVRTWFEDYYSGRTHWVATALVVVHGGNVRHDVVTTQVQMRADLQPWLDWYLSTGESLGKAGGYAIQGAGSIFVEQIVGSLSNVVGLPLESLVRLLPSSLTG